MIGPNLPNRPTPDVTLRNPGVFEQAAFPTFSPLMTGGLLPMTPLNLPGAPAGKEAGFKIGKNGMPEVSKKMQTDYIQSVIANYMQSSLELQASFSMFMGGPRA